MIILACPVCKKELELCEETKFCQFCGAKLVYVGVDPALLLRERQETIVRREDLRKRFWLWAMILGFGGFIVADNGFLQLGACIALAGAALWAYGNFLANKRFPLRGGR